MARRSAFGDMSNNIQYGMIGVGIIVIIVLVYFVFIKKPTTSAGSTSVSSTSVSSTSIGSTSVSSTSIGSTSVAGNIPIQVRVFPKAGPGTIAVSYDGNNTSFNFPAVNHTLIAYPVKNQISIAYNVQGAPASIPLTYSYSDLSGFANGGNQVCIDIIYSISGQTVTTVLRKTNTC